MWLNGLTYECIRPSAAKLYKSILLWLNHSIACVRMRKIITKIICVNGPLNGEKEMYTDTVCTVDEAEKERTYSLVLIIIAQQIILKQAWPYLSSSFWLPVYNHQRQSHCPIESHRSLKNLMSHLNTHNVNDIVFLQLSLLTWDSLFPLHRVDLDCKWIATQSISNWQYHLDYSTACTGVLFNQNVYPI